MNLYRFFSLIQNTKIWLDLTLLWIEMKDGFTSLHHLDLASGYQYNHSKNIVVIVEKMSDKLTKMIHQCKYMKAARLGLEKTTFHPVPWLLESVTLMTKVEIINHTFIISHFLPFPFHLSVGGRLILRGRLCDCVLLYQHRGEIIRQNFLPHIHTN